MENLLSSYLSEFKRTPKQVGHCRGPGSFQKYKVCFLLKTPHSIGMGFVGRLGNLLMEGSLGSFRRNYISCPQIITSMTSIAMYSEMCNSALISWEKLTATKLDLRSI